jgi:polar amino acid transport system substrate-binding protein
MRTPARKLWTVAAVLALSLTGCATDTDKTEVEGGAKVIEEGKLIVCTHLPYEPFQYNQGGEVVGFDVDLMDLVAEELGLEQKIFNTPFEKIETGLSMSNGDW